MDKHDKHDKTLIEIKRLYKVFGRKPKSVISRINNGESKDQILADTGHTVGLVDINLSINEGEVFVIMGLSGSGKSTLIRHINRLIDPTIGEIIINDTNILDLSLPKLRKFRRQRLSMVFQRFALMPHKTVIENVSYGLKIKGIKAKERTATARKWMSIVGLDGYEKQYPSQLSGGQQQRVGLARALATDADILLMDEAFSALDPLIRREMQEQLMELQKTFHKTIVFITHDLDEALRIGDRIAILKDGKLIQVGTPTDILMQPEDNYVKAFVKDVNLAKTLSVKSLMTNANHINADASIEEAIHQIQQSSNDYIHCINDGQYYGILELEKLKTFDDTTLRCQMACITNPSVHENSIIENILAKALASKHPIAIFNHQHHLVGEATHSSLVKFYQPKT